MWNSGRRSSASAAPRAVNRAPSVDVDPLKVLADQEALTPSDLFKEAARHQRPPGPVAATLLFHQSGQPAVCNCERMTMWQNYAEVGDKGSRLSWQQLQRPYRLRGVAANLISCRVTNWLKVKLNRSSTREGAL